MKIQERKITQPYEYLIRSESDETTRKVVILFEACDVECQLLLKQSKENDRWGSISLDGEMDMNTPSNQKFYKKTIARRKYLEAMNLAENIRDSIEEWI